MTFSLGLTNQKCEFHNNYNVQEPRMQLRAILVKNRFQDAANEGAMGVGEVNLKNHLPTCNLQINPIVAYLHGLLVQETCPVGIHVQVLQSLGTVW